MEFKMLYFLLTLKDRSKGIRHIVALSVEEDHVPKDVAEFYLESESMEYFRTLLPDHLSHMGDVIEVNKSLDAVVVIA